MFLQLARSHLLNIERGEDDGAKSFTVRRCRLKQKHKFNPKGIPGIFAAYEVVEI